MYSTVVQYYKELEEQVAKIKSAFMNVVNITN